MGAAAVWTTTARPMVTGRLRLTPVREGDAADVAAALDDVVLHRFIGGAPATAEQLAARYRRLEDTWSDDRSQRWFNWVLRTRTARRVVGTAQATVHGDRERPSADLAWVTAVPAQGRGYASEAAARVAVVLSSLGVVELCANVHPDHVASQRVAEHLGLTRTGETVEREERWSR